MPVAAAVVSTAASLYEGYEKNKQEKDAREQAQDAMNRQEGMAAQDKAWYDSNIRPFLKKMANEASQPGLSESGKLAEDSYLHGIGNIQMRQNAQATAGGADSNLNAATNTGMAMERQRGLADISLRDAINKKQSGVYAAQLAGFGSSADRSALAATGQQAAFQEGNANRLGQEADESWSGLANGMMGLAKLYAGSGSGQGQGAAAGPDAISSAMAADQSGAHQLPSGAWVGSLGVGMNGSDLTGMGRSLQFDGAISGGDQ